MGGYVPSRWTQIACQHGILIVHHTAKVHGILVRSGICGGHPFSVGQIGRNCIAGIVLLGLQVLREPTERADGDRRVIVALVGDVVAASCEACTRGRRCEAQCIAICGAFRVRREGREVLGGAGSQARQAAREGSAGSASGQILRVAQVRHRPPTVARRGHRVTAIAGDRTVQRRGIL